MDKNLVSLIRYVLREEAQQATKRKHTFETAGNLHRAEWWDGYAAALHEVAITTVDEVMDRGQAQSIIKRMIEDNTTSSLLSLTRKTGKRAGYDYALAIITIS